MCPSTISGSINRSTLLRILSAVSTSHTTAAPTYPFSVYIYTYMQCLFVSILEKLYLLFLFNPYFYFSYVLLLFFFFLSRHKWMHDHTDNTIFVIQHLPCVFSYTQCLALLLYTHTIYFINPVYKFFVYICVYSCIYCVKIHTIFNDHERVSFAKYPHWSSQKIFITFFLYMWFFFISHIDNGKFAWITYKLLALWRIKKYTFYEYIFVHL